MKGETESKEGGAKQILFLTPQLPYPLYQGTAIRNFGLIKGLAGRHQVSLLSFLEPDQSLQAAGPLLTLCQRVETVAAPSARHLMRRARDTLIRRLPDMGLRLVSPLFARRLADWLGRESFDVVHVEGIEMTPYLDLLLACEAERALPLVVFDDHNCEYMLQKRYAQVDAYKLRRWPGAFYSLLQWQKLRHYEASVCRRAHRVLAVSQTDAEALNRLIPGLEVAVIPNGIDTDQYQPAHRANQPTHQPTLVFTGKMDFRPNVDAVTWFADQIWPRIKAEIPEVHFYVMGQRPHPRLNRLRADPSLTFTGWVPDERMRSHIAQATLYVAPLRMGSGTRLKLLQAMALGKAIVSTKLGAEGLVGSPGAHQAVAGQELLLVEDDDPVAFAGAVVALLRDPAQRVGLGSAARAFVKAHYDWRVIIPRLEALYARR